MIREICGSQFDMQAMINYLSEIQNTVISENDSLQISDVIGYGGVRWTRVSTMGQFLSK